MALNLKAAPNRLTDGFPPKAGPLRLPFPHRGEGLGVGVGGEASSSGSPQTTPGVLTRR